MRIGDQFAQEIKGLFDGIATKKNIYINKVRKKKKEFIYLKFPPQRLINVLDL
jgi:hypothetical protein